MKYFLDCEFHEYRKKPLIGKAIDTIELISIGIVSEDFDKTLMPPCDVYSETVKTSKEYYAICKDFDLKAAWNNEWLRENVLRSIWKELKVKEYGGSIERCFTYNNLKWLINEYGKTREQIAKDIRLFVGCYTETTKKLDENNKWIEGTKEIVADDVSFYAYYSSYDWVVFCWLFGRMIDLPDGFPMYCIDLKQELDTLSKNWIKLKSINPKEDTRRKNTDEQNLKLIKSHPNYPKQTNEHNALADAKWNKELHKFIQSL